MVFALSTDDRTLHVFPDVETAVRHAEGVDVEDGVWLFFSDEGARLEPVFITPNGGAESRWSQGGTRFKPAAVAPPACLTTCVMYRPLKGWAI
jgi:hypothetical protein